MFGFFGAQRVTAMVSAGDTISDAMYIGNANAVSIELQTFDVGIETVTCNVYVQVANTASGTFQRVTVPGAYSAGSGIREWELPSSLGNRMVVVPWASNYSYLKLEVSKAVTASMVVWAHVKQ